MKSTYRRGELLRHVVFTAKIDAINFMAERAPVLPKRHFDHAHGALGFPLHDPVKAELVTLADDPLVRVEVAIDARPHKSVMPKLRADHALWDVFMDQTYTLLAENLFPWRGPGIPVGKVWSYSTAKPNHGRNWTRPTSSETLYFGRNTDPTQLKLYWKLIDQKRELDREQQSVRVELTLDRNGCDMVGLQRVGDLLGFGFRRKLRPYFHAIRPRLTPGLFRASRPHLGELLRARALRQLHQTVAQSGAHALEGHAWANTNKVASFESLNRKMRAALDDIIRIR